jgi:hypothetical protein
VHEWNNIPQSFIQRLIDWFYASEMRCCCCCKRWSHTLLNSANLHTAWKFCLSMICSNNDVEKFCWFCLICYDHMNLNYTIFVDFFLYVKNIEHQILVLFILLTSILSIKHYLSVDNIQVFVLDILK